MNKKLKIFSLFACLFAICALMFTIVSPANKSGPDKGNFYIVKAKTQTPEVIAQSIDVSAHNFIHAEAEQASDIGIERSLTPSQPIYAKAENDRSIIKPVLKVSHAPPLFGNASRLI